MPQAMGGPVARYQQESGSGIAHKARSRESNRSYNPEFGQFYFVPAESFRLCSNRPCRRSLEMSGSRPLELSDEDGLGDDECSGVAADRSAD